MLYRFNSAAAGEIVMLAPHAEEIFSAMDRPLEARGVLPASQLPAAIAAAKAINKTAIKRVENKKENIFFSMRCLEFRVF